MLLFCERNKNRFGYRSFPLPNIGGQQPGTSSDRTCVLKKDRMQLARRISTLSAALLLFLLQLLLATTATSQPAVLSSLPSLLKQNLPAFLKGLRGSYNRSAYASPFILWSPGAFPVALGDDNAKALPVVAAVQVPSAGRVVAFGHEGIPNQCCVNNDGWDTLVLNSIRWLAAGKKSVQMAFPSTSSWWASAGVEGVRRAMTGLRLTTSTMDLNSFETGGWANVDIYWMDTYTEYTPTQVKALVKFANTTGKGLLVGGHAWYWGYSHPNANIFTDLAANRVLWPLGLAVTTDLQIGFQPAPAKAPASWVNYNTFYLTNLLTAVKANTTTFTDKNIYPLANAVLTSLVKFVPSRANAAASGVTGVWGLLDSARSSSGFVVGPASPLEWLRSYPGNTLNVVIETAAIRRGDLSGLRASLSAAAYPGVPTTNATRVSVTVTINGTYNRLPYDLPAAGWSEPVWRSTGVYAPPGELITITLVTRGAIARGLQVQIGAHMDDLTDKTLWARVPYTISRFPLTDVNTTAGNPLGGLVYILVPVGAALGDVQVTISNVVRTPYFKLGTTSEAAWISTIRNYPGPWAELDSGKFVIMVPSKAIRNLSNPVPLLNHWNVVMDNMAYLANMPTDRASRAERFLVDADIGAGWMHSGYPIMAYDTPVVHVEMLDLSQLQAKGAWGPYHELGHNHQWGAMQFSGTGESFNNLWTIYALEKTGVPNTAWENWPNVSPAGRAVHRAEYFAKGANWERDWGVWVALDTYLQLKEGFGWDLYRKLYAVYQNFNGTLPAGDNVQTWIQQSSKVAGVNLVPFYAKWGFPISQETRAAVASLPTWAANPFNTAQ